MARMGNVEYSDLVELRNRLQRVDLDLDTFCKAITKELAARLLGKVIKRTPTDTGTLKRGWTAGQDGSIKNYLSALVVQKIGSTYTITIENPVKYGIYVEYGHRTRNGKRWVPGRFMLTISEEELRVQGPGIIRRKLDKHLREIFR